MGIQVVGLELKFFISNLKSDVFSKFLKKSHYFRKLGNFIYFWLHVCQVLAKSKKLFIPHHKSSFIIHHDQPNYKKWLLHYGGKYSLS